MTAVNIYFDRGHIFPYLEHMSRAPQKRRLETHARLLEAAKAIVADNSFAAMRVDEVVLKAGVAKGTFFAHFKDKDALMEALVAEDLAAAMVTMQSSALPDSVDAFVNAVSPLMCVFGSERIVFDLIMRHSGALALDEIGPIAQNFIDQIGLFATWIAPGQGQIFRADAPPDLLAEGVQAFLVQAVALSFCAVESRIPVPDRLRSYLAVWLAAPAVR